MRYARIAVAVVALVLLVWQGTSFHKISEDYVKNVANVKVESNSNPIKDLAIIKGGGTVNNSEGRSKAYYKLRKLADDYAGKRLNAWTNMGILALGAGIMLFALKD